MTYGPPTPKRCSSCTDWLPLDELPRNRRMHLGRSSRCRECHREATRDWRQRNRVKLNAARRVEYRAEHPLPERPCVVCGEPMRKRPDALVCSPSCRAERKNAHRYRARTCEVCGRSYMPSYGPQRTCGLECGRVLRHGENAATGHSRYLTCQYAVPARSVATAKPIFGCGGW